MDIILLILACFYINNKAKNKGLNGTQWVLKTIGYSVVFELLGGVIAYYINGGNIILAAVFGFFCAVGGMLLVKYRIDRTPAQNSNLN